MTMKRNSLTLIVGALLVIIFAFWLCAFQVRTTEVAVVTRFGRPDRDITNSGRLYFKLPPPIERVYKFDKRVQSFEDKFMENLTADGFNLLASVYVGWRITEPKLFFPKFPGGSVTEAQRNLEGLLSSSKKATVGKHPLSDFISTTGGGSKFAAIESEILAAVQSQIRTNNYGIEIEFLGIKRLGFPESVTQDVFNRMTRERGVLISAANNEGDARAQEIRSDADRRAAEVIAAAQGEAFRIQGRAEADAAKYLPVFQQDPGLASFLFRLNALESSLKERATLIFDQHMAPFDLLGGTLTNQPAK